MKFEPKTQEQLEIEKLLPKGEYDYEIKSGKDGTSDAGNEMISLVVKVYGNDGSEHIIWDWLTEAFPHKLRHASDSAGILDKYESGYLLAGDFEGATGKCIVDIQPESTNKKTGKVYPARNIIKDYLKRQLNTVSAARSVPIDDEIPF